MPDFKITVDTSQWQAVSDKYGDALAKKAAYVIKKYTEKIKTDAQDIIKEKGYVDTGWLVENIKPSVLAYADRAMGEVNAAAKYARFIHEGAEHDGDNVIKPHFVPFVTKKGKGEVTSLFAWADRHGLIYRKTKKGKRAKRSANAMATVYTGLKETWYYKTKSGKERAIGIDADGKPKGGLMVMTRATKFFEKPFMAEKEHFVNEMSQLVGGKD